MPKRTALLAGVVEVPVPPFPTVKGTSRVTAPLKVVVVKVEVPETERVPAIVVTIPVREIVRALALEVPILMPADPPVSSESGLAPLPRIDQPAEGPVRLPPKVTTPVKVEVPVTERVPSVEMLVERVVTAWTTSQDKAKAMVVETKPKMIFLKKADLFIV